MAESEERCDEEEEEEEEEDGEMPHCDKQQGSNLHKRYSGDAVEIKMGDGQPADTKVDLTDADKFIKNKIKVRRFVSYVPM